MTFSRWLLLLLIVTFTPLPADADRTSTVPTQGLLWRIEQGGHRSYLFGTFHSDDPRVVQLPAPVARAFAQSSSFVMEALPSADGMIAAATAMTLTGTQTLPDVIGADLYQKVRAAVLAHGQPVADLEHQKPWAVVMLLSYPVYKGLPLDYSLLMQATRAGKKVAGLETTEEQIAMFDGLSLADQTHLLALTVEQSPNYQAQLDKLMAAYLARDLGALQSAERDEAAQGDPTYRLFMQRLIHDRNARMADRLGPHLKQGNAFVAVGAMHLAGDDGLLQRLSQLGWQVERVY